MSNEFLDRMKKIGDEHGKQGGGSFITQMSIEFGFWVYVKDHDRLTFWKRCENEEEAPIVKAEIQARLDKQQINEEPDYCMRVFADRNMLGRDAYEWDRNEFYPRWSWEKKDDGIETCFTLIIDSMEKNNLPLGEKFWGRFQLKANPFHVAQGEAGKKPSKKDPSKSFFPTFALPTEKFANEQAARDAVGDSGSSTNATKASSQWSQRAYDEFNQNGDMSNFEKSHDEILKNLEKAQRKEAMAPGFPIDDYLPSDPSKPMNPVKAKLYIAKIYNIETSDIDLMIPF